MKTSSLRLSESFVLASIIAVVFFALSCQSAAPNAVKEKSRVVVEGQVVDRNGRPVSQTAVKIEAISGNELTSVAFTDFGGTFQFFDLPAGRYRLSLVEPDSQSKLIELHGSGAEEVGTISLQRDIQVALNKDAARNISPEAAKSINSDAAQTLNPEAAKTINSEAARTINPAAAQTINSEAARTINPAAAKTLNSEAAKTLNPEAAKVLNADRAKFLTKEQAQKLTPQEASKPLNKN
jgi:hypothetical protein